MDTNFSETSGTGNADDSGTVLENAISVRIGRDGAKEWSVNMYNNDAAMTMLDYLFGSACGVLCGYRWSDRGCTGSLFTGEKSPADILGYGISGFCSGKDSFCKYFFVKKN